MSSWRCHAAPEKEIMKPHSNAVRTVLSAVKTQLGTVSQGLTSRNSVENSCNLAVENGSDRPFLEIKKLRFTGRVQVQ